MQTQVNGIEVTYAVSGPDTGPTVMLSHSLGSSAVMWGPQLAALSQRYRVLLYDTRGHGGSAAPAGPYSLDMLGDDAIALLDALRLDRVHWVGLSMGGMIGQNLALRAPGRLASLTLCDTTAQIPAEAQAMWDERIAAARDEGMTALAEATMQRWFTPDYLAQAPRAVDDIRAQFLDTPVDGFVGCCYALKELDYLDRLAEIALPTLVMVGADDPSTPVAASEAMQTRIDDAELVVIPSASHLANVEQPDAFTEALLDFLDRQH